MSSRQKIIIIAGPTAVGKTSLSLDLADRFNGEIISADAVSVYRYMDIGTAKPTPEERAAAPHHLIDVVDPDEHFDAAVFAEKAGALARSMKDRGGLPLVVGGTGFYIKALTHGLFQEGASDRDLRKSLKSQALEQGKEAMHRRLNELDPAAAARIHPNDEYRVVRALEVCILTGRPVSAQQQAHGFSDCKYDVLIFCLQRDREELYERINTRVDGMLAQGLEDEVRGLLERGYHSGLKSMQSIGYRHMCMYIEGELDYEEAVTLLKRDTRRFAKRQMTWFRSYPEVKWAASGDAGFIMDSASSFLE